MTKQKLPEHIESVPPGREAHAPYNFVPLPNKVVLTEEVPFEERVPPKRDKKGQVVEEYPYTVRQDMYHANRYTGTIACTLATASPLYVRCALTTAQFKQAEAEKRLEQIDEQSDWRQLAKNTPDFFYAADVETPVIPGSSLRGMLRALVEIASYSKMSLVTKERLFFRTVDNTSIGKAYRKRMNDKVRGGWLTLNGHTARIEEILVYKVPRTLLTSLFPKGYYDGKSPNLRPNWTVHQHSVFVKTAPYRNAQANSFGLVTEIQFENPHPHSRGWVPGMLVITGDVSGKRHEFVFVRKDKPEQWFVNEEIVHRFHNDDQLTLWQRDAFPKDKPQGANRQRKGMLPRDVPEPIFFLLSEEEEPKVVFFGRAGMFRLPYLHSPYEFIPAAHHLPETDLAEAIFGHVSRDDKVDPRKPIAGRIFVDDGLLKDKHDDVLFDKPVMPQILATPKPTTFQHYLVQTSSNKRDLRHYASESESETVIRGHKLYWHKGEHPSIGLPQDQHDISENQKTLIRPVKAGTTFAFTIRFENLSNVELGALLWVLRIAADKDYRLKLGIGKPLGMGAVQITSSVQISKRDERYKELFAEDGWAVAEDEMSDEARDACIKAFEQYVLKMSEEKVERLEDTPRIQCLLALLGWPGPDAEKTRYMEIKRKFSDGYVPAAERDVQKAREHRRDKVNEYASRPVLPTPRQAINKTEQLDGSSVMQSRTQPSRESQARSSSAGEAVPASPSQPVRFKGTVARKRGEAYVVEIKKNDLQRLRLSAKQRSYEIRLSVAEAPEPNMGKGAPVPMCIIDRIDDDDEVIWIKRAPSKKRQIQ